jgi:hypothetical protein
LTEPDGTWLRTLREAISHLVKPVPKAEWDMTEVLTAAEMLTNAPSGKALGCLSPASASCRH